jgi:hypothetical protein
MSWIGRIVGLAHTVLPVPPLLPFLPVLIYGFSALRQRVVYPNRQVRERNAEDAETTVGTVESPARPSQQSQTRLHFCNSDVIAPWHTRRLR